MDNIKTESQTVNERETQDDVHKVNNTSKHTEHTTAGGKHTKVVQFIGLNIKAVDRGGTKHTTEQAKHRAINRVQDMKD